MYNIAIDGPAGAGKSTIAKLLAKELNFLHIDTGAMFRAVAVYIKENNLDINKENEFKNSINNLKLDIKFIDNTQRVFVLDKDVTDKLRAEDIGELASIVSTYDFVRKKLLDVQRNIANNNNIIMDGRDIGSVVLPKADLKIYLTADVCSRAKRRYDQLKEEGLNVDIEEIKKEIIKRDERDKNRINAPLKIVDDAIVIDNSTLKIDEVLYEIKKHVHI